MHPSTRQYNRGWSRWLLAWGVPVEHVAIVLDLTPGEVESLIASSARYVSTADAELCHRMRAEGSTYRHVAHAVGRSRQTVWGLITRGTHHTAPPPRPPFRRPRSAILAQTARHVRTLTGLGYTAEQIAELLVVDASTVQDFLARLEPIRKARALGDHRTRPREPREEHQVRLNLQQPKDRRRVPVDDQVVDERRDRHRLHRSPVDAWGPRGTAAEIADYNRFLAAVREGRLSGPELLGLAARVHYAEPRRSGEAPEPEPAIWTGASELHLTGAVALNAQQMLEAADLLRRGTPWAHVARHFEVSENTLRRYIDDIAPRRTAAIYPTEAVRYEHGTVRWDLPLGTTKDRTHRTVLVECECGRERRVWTTQVTRPQTTFMGLCEACHRRAFIESFRRSPQPESEPILCACGCGRPVKVKGSKFVKGHHRSKMSAADAREARRLHEEGLSNREVAARYGMSEHGIYKITSGRSRVIESDDLPSPAPAH